MMEHERWAKYFATYNFIECFSELVKITEYYFNVVAHYVNVKRFFPCCSHKTKSKRNRSKSTSFYSIEAVLQFKISFMQ